MAAPIRQLFPDEGAPPVEEPNPMEIVPAPSDPMGVARVLLDQMVEDGQSLLRWWRGQWMRYQGPHWAEEEGAGVRKHVYAALEHATYYGKTKDGEQELKPWNPNRARVGDVIAAMEGIVLLGAEAETPSWLDSDEPAGHVIACANGLLDVRDQRLYHATPRYFGTVSVPFDYDPAAARPDEWLGFLRSIWPQGDDGTEAQEIESLQEWFGYVLSGRTDLQKILMLVGPPRSGKGTITRTLERLVGRGNYCSPTLAGLGTNFGLQPLLGRVLATIADARLGRDNANVVVERLLSISGEDTLTVDRKHRDAWSGKIPARLVLCSNELPRFSDASGAISSRFVVLAMERSFLGAEDTDLDARIVAELPGILRWALAGLVRLNRQRRLTVPPGSAEMMQVLQDLVSPMGAFVKEALVLDAEQTVAVDDIYRHWNAWAAENGHTISSSKAKFSSDIRSVVPALKDYRPKGEARQWRGVGMDPEWLARPRDVVGEGWHMAGR